MPGLPPKVAPAHPEKPLTDLPTALSSLTCLQRGLCPVSSRRGSRLKSHSIYYEVHGSPETTVLAIPPHNGDGEVIKDHIPPKERLKNKMVFISGWNATCLYWAPQVRWFGGGVHRTAGDEEEKEEYTVLVFDNRGIGNSGYPRGPYTTGGMAEDVICLLDYLGWTADRELNIVGTSLGGMIAQELAYRIPNRISSLLLAVTTQGGYSICSNLPPWKGLCRVAKLAFTADQEAKASGVMGMLFTSKWLDSIAENDETGRTNRQIQAEELSIRLTFAKPQRFLGNISQLAAALTHHVSPSRLTHISARIPKIIMVTGDEDYLVAPKESRKLWRGMTSSNDRKEKKDDSDDEKKKKGGPTPQDLLRVELVEFEDTGHGIHLQREGEFNKLVMRCVEEGRNLDLNADLGS